jgi:hypothetical protein
MNKLLVVLGLAALIVSVLFAGPPKAQAGVVLEGVVIDPHGAVRPELLTRALSAWNARDDAKRERIAVVDFSLPSETPRLHIVDLQTGAVRSYLSAHGKGSDRAHSGRATSFSNENGSNASSVGAYLGTVRYHGQHGLSLRLRGLDPTNSNAESRAIVIHSAPYMDAAWRRAHGRPGRSFGCFTVETSRIEEVVSALEGGVMLYAAI